jgi:UDP-N-acetylglucosamine--N-acetylmuramyl-(pentapeptide) pyrophosphoryl-undecaprenol N-acetylglucosamine transferase
MRKAVMIVAGGTGGHVYPGLAVAADLGQRGVNLHWMGTELGIEARIVPKHGLAFTIIPVSALRRTGALRWLSAPLTISYAVLCAVRAIWRVDPAVVLGMGGFVSGPGGIAAWLCRRPLVIHEQNAVPGLTNRILSHFARRVLEAFPGSFSPSIDATVTGNPVRAEIAAIAPPASREDQRRGLNVLVFGGSHGSRRLNEIVPAAIAACGIGELSVHHQCGQNDLAAVSQRYRACTDRVTARIEPYIEDMAAAYAQADLVIARAGAITVAEIAACGVASILVPYPYAVDDHQTANAKYLVNNGAAILLPEHELDSADLAALLARLLADRPRMLDMAERARALARPQASAAVAAICLELLDA